MSDGVSVLERLYRSSDGSKRFRKFNDGTPDPTKYHDISDVHFVGSNGVSISNFLPGNHGFAGWRGIVIPRSRPDGGSRGFDCHAPQKCYIDPELTNGQIEIDFSVLHKDKINAAFKLASEEATGDASDRAIVAYLHMAEMSKQAAVAKHPPAPPADVTSRPLGSFAGHAPLPPLPPPQAADLQPPEVEPARPQAVAASCGDPFLRQLSPRPVGPGLRRPPPVDFVPPLSIVKDVQTPAPAARKQAMHHVPAHQPASPMRKVLVELPKPLGQFHAHYHDVIRTEDLLILVYDHHAGNGQHVWFPPAPDVEPNEAGQIEDPVQLGVLVYDPDGRPDTGFIVFPTSARFTYEGKEFCLLSIFREKAYKGAEGTNVEPGTS